MSIDLVPIWTLILGAGVFLYVVLDGFDLGVGMLFAFARDFKERNLIINSISPIWDGNETWLVIGGTGLLAAFPLAFAIIVPAVYFPILIMLMGLILRGVAFEFRFSDRERRGFWDQAFAYASAAATFAQGIVLGAFVQGFAVTGRQYSGSSFDCFTAFSIFTGLALMFGYTLLGAGWLVFKTQGPLQARMRKAGRAALIATLLAIAVISLWTPLTNSDIARRWLAWPHPLFLSPVPLATVVVVALAWRALGKGEFSPFIYGVGLFGLSYFGIAISLFPMIVPHHFSLEQAASDPGTQGFLAIGTLFLLPVILSYTGWSYWVFRGKVRSDSGYGGQ